MKALIVYGSPHGNKAATYRLGSNFADGLKEQDWSVEEVFINDIEINHCLGCRVCWLQTPGVCVLKDGMTELLEKHKSIDLLVLAAPLYFFHVPGKVKDYWDRNMPLFYFEYQKFQGQEVESWLDSTKFLLVSTCGFPDKACFDGLVASTKRIYGPAYAGDMLVPSAGPISQDVDGSKYTEIYEFFHNAGKEYGKNNNLTGDIKNTYEEITRIDKLQELIKSKQ